MGWRGFKRTAEHPTGNSKWGKVIDSWTGTTASAKTIDRWQGGHYGIDKKVVTNDFNPWQTYKHETSAELSAPAEAEAAAQAEEQRGIDNNVNLIDAKFGLYRGAPGTNLGLETIAAQGQADRTAAHGAYKQAFLDYFQPQIDNQMHDATTRAHWAAVNHGTEGGSADQVRLRPIGSKYVAAQQQLGANAESGVANLTATEDRRRISLENLARTGDAPEGVVADQLRGLGQDYDSARNQIASGTVGDIFGAGAAANDSYQNAYGTAQGTAMGGRGPALFGDTSRRTTGSAGSYT